MTKYHPDKQHQQKDTIEDVATKITHGYSILQDDHARALHLLELNDMPMEENMSGDVVGQTFLLTIMELREEVEDAKSENELKELLKNNRERMSETCQKLSIAFGENDLMEAKRLTAMLQYWKRIDELIIEKL